MKLHFLFLILIIIISNFKFIYGNNNNYNSNIIHNKNNININKKQLKNCFNINYYTSKDINCSENPIYTIESKCGNNCIQASPVILLELNNFVTKFDLSMIIYCNGTIDFYDDYYCNKHQHSLNVLLPHCFSNKLNHPPFNINSIYCNESYINEYNNINNENTIIIYFFLFVIIASIIFKYFFFHDLKKTKFF